MKFGDFFLPKINRSDPKARMEAVLTENHVPLLQQVAEKDQSPEVRAAARKRLEEITQ
ncbi:MAG: hypothetical protein ABIL58_09520 [Pseudomonadota bacterium]